MVVFTESLNGLAMPTIHYWPLLFLTEYQIIAREKFAGYYDFNPIKVRHEGVFFLNYLFLLRLVSHPPLTIALQFKPRYQMR